MIYPMVGVWKQLDGPQIKAIRAAVYAHVSEQLDSILTYLSSVGIDNATDEHLTLLGTLAGLPRPYISTTEVDDILFSEKYEHNSLNGFADAEGNPGGKFIDVSTGSFTSSNIQQLDITRYRAALRAWLDSPAEVGSLALLDAIVYALTQIDTVGGYPYKYSFIEAGDVPKGRAPGDLYIDLGQQAFWKNPILIYNTVLALANSVYAPVPQIFVSIGNRDVIQPPVVIPSPGNWIDQTEINILTEGLEEGTIIYYTIDGSDPIEKGIVYTAPIPISSVGMTLKAVANIPYYGYSETGTYVYKAK